MLRAPQILKQEAEYLSIAFIAVEVGFFDLLTVLRMFNTEGASDHVSVVVCGDAHVTTLEYMLKNIHGLSFQTISTNFQGGRCARFDHPVFANFGLGVTQSHSTFLPFQAIDQ